MRPVLPAVTTTAQSCYVTGKWPSEHGIVGNGWYDRQDAEVKFWKQSNRLVEAEKIWERAKRDDPSFTCSKMFWWYNMYAAVDYSVTPRPQYHADGLKMPRLLQPPRRPPRRAARQIRHLPAVQFLGPANEHQMLALDRRRVDVRG